MLVTLIGYRGTGKSTVARMLADRLHWACVDADDVIESRAGCSIADLFAKSGEVGFRSRERSVMHDLLQRDGIVLSAGGGAVLNPDTRREMRSAGPVIWLTAGVDTILSRISADDSSQGRRPRLTDADARHEIEQLLKQREPLYRETADVTVDTEGLIAAQVVEGVLTALAPRLQEGAAG